VASELVKVTTAKLTEKRATYIDILYQQRVYYLKLDKLNMSFKLYS